MTIAIRVAQTRRHLQRLAGLARAMLVARSDMRAQTHVAWLMIAGFIALLFSLRELGWLFVPTLALFGALALVILFDAAYFIIPDTLILFLLACGSATLFGNEAAEPPLHIAAALVAYAAFRLIAALYERFRGEPGLGLGDAKLFAVAGLWLGFEGLPSCLLTACVSAALSALLSFRGGALMDAREPIPFGPHLALGLWLAWAIGPLQTG